MGVLCFRWWLQLSGFHRGRYKRPDSTTKEPITASDTQLWGLFWGERSCLPLRCIPRTSVPGEVWCDSRLLDSERHLRLIASSPQRSAHNCMLVDKHLNVGLSSEQDALAQRLAAGGWPDRPFCPVTGGSICSVIASKCKPELSNC